MWKKSKEWWKTRLLYGMLIVLGLLALVGLAIYFWFGNP